MKMQHLSGKLTLKKFAILLSLATVGVISGLGSNAWAQMNQNGLPEPYQSNEQDPSKGGTFGNNFNPLDLIHRANFNPSRSATDFEEDTNENINKAAQDFKRQQQERLQQQTNPPTTPTPSN